MKKPPNRLVTVEPSAQEQYWPDDVDAGDGALEQVKSIWPFLPRNLRLAIVAIATLVDQSTMATTITINCPQVKPI